MTSLVSHKEIRAEIKVYVQAPIRLLYIIRREVLSLSIGAITPG